MGDKQLQLFYTFLSFRPTDYNNLLFIKIPNTSQFTSFRNTTFSESNPQKSQLFRNQFQKFFNFFGMAQKRVLLKALSILNI